LLSLNHLQTLRTRSPKSDLGTLIKSGHTLGNRSFEFFTNILQSSGSEKPVSLEALIAFTTPKNKKTPQ